MFDEGHVTPLEQLLQRIHGTTVTVRADVASSESAADEELARRVARQFNKPGGPKIRRRAIAD